MATNPLTTNAALFCSILETARMLGRSRSTTYELMDAGSIRSVKLGKRRLIEIASINSFAASLTFITPKQAPLKEASNGN